MDAWLNRDIPLVIPRKVYSTGGGIVVNIGVLLFHATFTLQLSQSLRLYATLNSSTFNEIEVASNTAGAAARLALVSQMGDALYFAKTAGSISRGWCPLRHLWPTDLALASLTKQSPGVLAGVIIHYAIRIM